MTSIETSAYAVEPEVFQLFRETDNALDVVLYPADLPPPERGLPVGWAPPRVGFGTWWDDLMRVLWACDQKPLVRTFEASERLVYERYDHWVRALEPEQVQEAAVQLRELDPGALVALGLRRHAKGTEGDVLTRDDYAEMLGGFEELLEFFGSAAEAGAFVVLVTV